MDPNNYEQPGLRLPEPQVNREALSTSPEASPEMLSVAQPQLASQPALPAPVASSTAVSSPIAQTNPVSLAMSTPSLADDTDLIEKEWVVKAKVIVERTKDDPYQQNSQMSHFKADYLKKRYSKDIKISSES